MLAPEYDVTFVNLLLNEPVPDLGAFDAVIIGGSGEVHLDEDHTNEVWFPIAMGLIDEILEKNMPLFGICFGFQLLALHQGARVVAEEGGSEVGSFDITALEAASADPIFSALPQTYVAQEGHNLIVRDFPSQCIQLARSERVDCQAYRIEGTQAWATLYHPELNMEQTRERTNLYGDEDYNFTGGVNAQEDILRESPEASRVIPLFLAQTLGSLSTSDVDVRSAVG